jgi:hypothetical protein
MQQQNPNGGHLVGLDCSEVGLEGIFFIRLKGLCESAYGMRSGNHRGGHTESSEITALKTSPLYILLLFVLYFKVRYFSRVYCLDYVLRTTSFN